MDKKITLRLATRTDAKQLLAIYAPYVSDTAITFECRVPSVREFASRITHILSKFPYYVALVDGEIAGYAYASPYRTREAYHWTAETTIYIHQAHCGYGIGSMLYSALEETLKTQGIITMLACIAYPNPPSMQFHKTMGFHKVGHFSRCGYKMEQWLDVVWMEKQIGIHQINPPAVTPFPKLGE